MTAQIRPNRLSVSDRFPMLGFSIHTGVSSPRRIEVTLATDPALFDDRAARRPENFFCSTSIGPLTVESGEAAYVVPTEVMARFVDAERLYFALASGPVDSSALTVDVRPAADSPYISIAGLTGRSLRRVRMFPQRGARTGDGYGDAAQDLTWAGDAALPGMATKSRTPAGNGGTAGQVAGKGGANGAGGGTASQPGRAQPAADYDDGFGPLPEVASDTAGGEGSAEAQAYTAWARAQEAISDNPSSEETERWLNRQAEDRRLAERRRQLDSILPVQGIDHVDDDFKLRACDIAEELGMDVNHLMAVMSFETGGSFSPSQRNAAGSGATGLIQFMPSTARKLGTSTEALAAMTALEQLDWVKKYFEPFAGRLNNLQDTYMAVLWPAAIGKAASHVLWRQGTKAYEQNSGLDTNRDGEVTAGEAAGRVSSILSRAQAAARAQAQSLSRTLSADGWPDFYQQGKSRDNQSYDSYKAALSAAQLGAASGYGGTALPVYESELTAADLQEIYPQLAADLQAGKVSAAKIERYAEALNQAFALTGLDTVEAQAAYLAHAAVEADQLRRFTETQSWRQNYEDDPARIRLDSNWLNQAAQNNANYRLGGQINPGGDASWQQSFLGRGPLQVTFRYHYAQTLALLERLAERRRAAGLNDSADALLACVAAVKADPRQAASPGHGFLFSAGYMKMAEGDRHILDAGASPSFNGTGPESARWMTGGTREQPEKANAKRQAYQRALAVLNRKTEGQARTAAMRADSRALDNGVDPFAVEIKYRMFIPSPAIKGPVYDDDFGGDNRGFQYTGGSSRGEITAVVHLNERMGIDSIDVVDRHWGETKAYDSDHTRAVSGKPDWWLALASNAAVKERSTLAVSDDNLRIYAGAPAARNAATLILDGVHWAAVTIEADGSNPLTTAPSINADVTILLRYRNGLIEAKAFGHHDGFPAHELYVNGEPLHRYDPVAAGKGPTSLFGTGDQDVGTDWETVARTYTVRIQGESQGLGARALEFNESFTLNWDELELINQPTNMSCWAAAGAMVVGWRDRVSLTPQTIAEIGGRTTANGLRPADVGQFAEDLGLVAEPPMSWSQQGFRELLESSGPLWVASAPAGLHAIVVTGLYNEGEQLYVRISDPWDRAVGTPGAPGAYASTHSTGSRYIMKWEDFAREYERPAHAGLVFLQILHSGGVAGRQPNRGSRTPQGYAQALNADQASASPPSHGPATAPLRITFAAEQARVLPPLIQSVGTDAASGWSELVAEFNPALSARLQALPALAATHGWTLGVGREDAGGAVGSGIGVCFDGSLFRYGPPPAIATAPAQQATQAPLLVTVVEGGLESFTAWSRAHAFTASDGVTGALLLSADGLPVGAALRLSAAADAGASAIAQRIEALVLALRQAHAGNANGDAAAIPVNGGGQSDGQTNGQSNGQGNGQTNGQSNGQGQGPLTAPRADGPAATVPAERPAAMAFSGQLNSPAMPAPATGFPPAGVQIFRSDQSVNGVNYQLFLMDGQVMPAMPPAIAADLLPAEPIVIDAWPYIDGPAGRSHGGVAIHWSHAAGAVASVRTTPTDAAALDGWRVSVRTDIAPGASTANETRLKVTITTRFERDGTEPQTGITDVILTGAGQHEIIYRKQPVAAPAAA